MINHQDILAGDPSSTDDDMPMLARLYGGIQRNTNSHERIGPLLDQVVPRLLSGRRADQRLALRLFHSVWSDCDNTAGCAKLLEWILRAYAETAVGLLDTDARAAFEALSRQVTVFRGCDRKRVHGFAWTLDRNVAAGFARGHRGIRNPDPVIATATVAKEHVFGLYLDRKEAEVLTAHAMVHTVHAWPSFDVPEETAGEATEQ